ncbi:MAG TPA: D-alanyl-D-alanine carboxypeptidase [Clostridiales bacterium]|nr:D-alanyl-D-alanine carboxypeptidase [Clostridiales bacterium]
MKQACKRLFFTHGGRLRRLAVLTSVFLTAILFFSGIPVSAEPKAEDTAPEFGLDCVSAILMEAQTGRVLYEKNADEPLPPASVTKIMTLLLVMEAIERGVFTLDTVLATSTRASQMGGSQIYLKEGEQMRVEDLIKSVVIASANDAAVVLAEAVAGSEEAFVAEMNKRATELGMKTAHFENTNGLDDTVTNHVLSARDIAIMSRELIKYEKILEFSSTWMDSVRDGAFGLTNTNRLIRFYRGATGLKTGSTSKAKFCMSATAERDGMSLIAVIMAAPTRDARNSSAAALLDWGFANYSLYRYDEGEDEDIPVLGGVENILHTAHGDFCTVVKKGEEKKVEAQKELPESVSAPVRKGDAVGAITFRLDGGELGRIDISAAHGVDKISFGGLLLRMLKRFFLT